jgi:hypothetical protein
MSNPSKLPIHLRIAARSALIVAASVFLIGAFRFALDVLLTGERFANWPKAVEISGVLAGVAFTGFFSYILVRLRLREPVLNVLEEEISASDMQQPPLWGFVAMEYYRLILNRTYLVFISPEGMYGWKAEGIVTNSNRDYFQPYQEMLEDPVLLRDRNAIRKLSQLPGGFFLPVSEVSSVKVIDGQKWGMGGIPHSGRILVSLSSGKSREFILLGSVYNDGIRDKMLATLNSSAILTA